MSEIIYGPETLNVPFMQPRLFRLVAGAYQFPDLQFRNDLGDWETTASYHMAVNVITHLLAKHAAEKPEKVEVSYVECDSRRHTFHFRVFCSEHSADVAPRYATAWLAKALYDAQAKIKSQEQLIEHMQQQRFLEDGLQAMANRADTTPTPTNEQAAALEALRTKESDHV